MKPEQLRQWHAEYLRSGGKYAAGNAMSLSKPYRNRWFIMDTTKPPHLAYVDNKAGNLRTFGDYEAAIKAICKLEAKL